MGLVVSPHMDPSLSILCQLTLEDLQLDFVHGRYFLLGFKLDSFFCRLAMVFLGLASMGANVDKVCMHKGLGVENFSWRHHDVIGGERWVSGGSPLGHIVPLWGHDVFISDVEHEFISVEKSSDCDQRVHLVANPIGRSHKVIPFGEYIAVCASYWTIVLNMLLIFLNESVA